jgi:uroporphyrinogen-III synthase
MTAPLVLLTRPEAAGGALTAALTRLGYRVAAVPAISIEAVAPGGMLDRAAGTLAEYDWVVVTSPTGVAALTQARARVATDGRLPSKPPHWAAVGPATARALLEAGALVEVVPDQADGVSLARALASHVALAGASILLPRSDAAADELPRLLRLAGASVDDLVAYRTIEAPAASLGPLADALDDPALTAIVLASGSAVRGLLQLAAQVGRLERARHIPIVSIGPSTSAAARIAGWEPAAEADAATPEALARAVLSVSRSTARNHSTPPPRAADNHSTQYQEPRR